VILIFIFGRVKSQILKMILNQIKSGKDDLDHDFKITKSNHAIVWLALVMMIVLIVDGGLWSTNRPVTRRSSLLASPPGSSLTNVYHVNSKPRFLFQCHFYPVPEPHHNLHNKRRYVCLSVCLSVCCRWPAKRLGQSRPNLA